MYKWQHFTLPLHDQRPQPIIYLDRYNIFINLQQDLPAWRGGLIIFIILIVTKEVRLKSSELRKHVTDLPEVHLVIFISLLRGLQDKGHGRTVYRKE